MEYRGIKLAESVNLYMKDGRFNDRIKNGLDFLADLLIENDHKILTEYVRNKDKVLIDYQCGHDPHSIKPNKYKIGRGCPKCSRRCPKQSKENLIKLVETNGHLLLSEYSANEIKVLIDFQCGHQPHEITPGSYKNGNGCPKCGDIRASEKRSKLAKEDFISLMESNGHELVDGEYVNNYTKVLIDFNCGHPPNWIIPQSYKNGNRCPICKESKGEKRIRKWLEENDNEFESQKVFDGLVGTGGGLLTYDFYIPKLNILIEYQGEFHDGSSGWYSRLNLENQQEHDRRKRDYAKLHNIKLLEIWHWDFDNIEEILFKKIIF